jgi:hypothetical protein
MGRLSMGVVECQKEGVWYWLICLLISKSSSPFSNYRSLVYFHAHLQSRRKKRGRQRRFYNSKTCRILWAIKWIGKAATCSVIAMEIFWERACFHLNKHCNAREKERHASNKQGLELFVRHGIAVDKYLPPGIERLRPLNRGTQTNCRDEIFPRVVVVVVTSVAVGFCWFVFLFSIPHILFFLRIGPPWERNCMLYLVSLTRWLTPPFCTYVRLGFRIGGSCSDDWTSQSPLPRLRVHHLD